MSAERSEERRNVTETGRWGWRGGGNGVPCPRRKPGEDEVSGRGV